jgi:O-antigen/teichoic acid export membrane protein
VKGRWGEALRNRLPAVARLHGALLSNAASMMSTTLITSLLGVVFWLVAARYFSQAAVGVGSAAVSAMTLLGFGATLGMGTLLMGELPRRDGSRRALLDAALAVTTLAGAVLGLGFAVLAPLFSSDLESLGASWQAALLFAACTGLTALAYVLDQALIGLLHGGLQLARNVVFAIAKLVALVPVAALVADPDSTWIYSVWGGGIAISLFVLAGFYREREGEAVRPDFAQLGGLRGSAASHHGFNLALLAPSMLVPIVVVALISASANASFYVAWMIAGFLAMVPVSLGTVLYAVASADASRLTEQLRFTFLISFAVGVAANLVLIVAAEPILRIFGAEYAEQATAPLHVLALGIFPLTIKTQYVALQRVRHRVGSALPIAWGGAVLEVGGAAIGAWLLGGLSGVAWGWFAGLALEALVMAAPVLRALRTGVPPDSPATQVGRDSPVGVSEPGRP